MKSIPLRQSKEDFSDEIGFLGCTFLQSQENLCPVTSPAHKGEGGSMVVVNRFDPVASTRKIEKCRGIRKPDPSL
jgi:hypothetical protein